MHVCMHVCMYTCVCVCVECDAKQQYDFGGTPDEGVYV